MNATVCSALAELGLWRSYGACLTLYVYFLGPNGTGESRTGMLNHLWGRGSSVEQQYCVSNKQEGKGTQMHDSAVTQQQTSVVKNSIHTCTERETQNNNKLKLMLRLFFTPKPAGLKIWDRSVAVKKDLSPRSSFWWTSRSTFPISAMVMSYGEWQKCDIAAGGSDWDQGSRGVSAWTVAPVTPLWIKRQKIDR